MRARCLAWLGAVVVVASGAGVAVRADDKKIDVTGDWKYEVKRPDGDSFEVNLKLKQEGEKVTGTLGVASGQFDPVEIKDGKIKNGEFSFQIMVERDGNTFSRKFKGKVDGDTIKGKVEFERDGETQTRDWEAKRVAKEKS